MSNFLSSNNLYGRDLPRLNHERTTFRDRWENLRESGKSSSPEGLARRYSRVAPYPGRAYLWRVILVAASFILVFLLLQ